MPSPLARDQVLRALGLRHRLARGLRVWCWEELWSFVGEARADGPAWLSPAAARAALGEAITRARRDGELDAVAAVLDWPGFRRRLCVRIAAWTRAQRAVEAGPPGDDPAERARWAVFVRYRRLLHQIDAEDGEGFAVWASARLLDDPPAGIKQPGQVVFLDPALDSRAQWRALEFAQARGRSVGLTLAFDPDPALAEAYAGPAAVRRKLLDRGFVETAATCDLWRPQGLRDVEHGIFRADAHRAPRLSSTNGLKVLGAPQGEGVALVVARRLKDLLAEGIPAEDVLVLFRRWDDDAELVLDMLQAWGLPATATRRRSLDSAPTFAALRLAMRLPVDDWESAPLVQLLRHGRLRPAWLAGESPLALATAASVIQSSRVFRGFESLKRALDRAASEARPESAAVRPVDVARDVVSRLAKLVDPLGQSRPWSQQVEQVRGLAATLGLDDGALDALWDALDDHGAVLARLGRDGRGWGWAEFTREVEAMAAELAFTIVPAASGAIRLAAVDDVAGARARFIVLANLGEGTFPAREAIDVRLAIEPDAEAEGEEGVNLAFAREMLRFLRVVGSAESGLVVAYPTSDPQGQELLRAGFLEDLLGLFTPEAAAATDFHESSRRFDPALSEWPQLAGAPADLRVHTVARACQLREFGPLEALASQPAHRAVLEGSAAALRVADARLQSTRFGEYDGRLADDRAIHEVLAKFGPSYTFSPSQLESYLFCPFQFFLRYLLKLEPVDERDELEEDYTERGSRVHKVLEDLERMLVLEPGSRLDRVEGVISGEMGSELDGGSDIDGALNEIERRRMVRTLRRYARQHQAYETAKGPVPSPHRFEVVFGLQESLAESYEPLVLGTGADAVRLQGKIDRIDLVSAGEEPAFRIIDYKTGACPSKKDVKEAIYLQLPLYALAVESVVLEGKRARLHDVGYWGLAALGFRPIALKDWERDRDELQRYVTAVVAQLRRGSFVIDSCKDDCTQRCEFHSVCRIRQVRSAGKRRDDAPRLELNV